MNPLRFTRQWKHWSPLAFLALALGACVPGTGGAPEPDLRTRAQPTPSPVRTARRAYDGAPPIIPHPPFESPCTACHFRRPIAVQAQLLPDSAGAVRLAPANPHAGGAVGAPGNCVQCHVQQRTSGTWVASSFEGLRRAPTGLRHHSLAPPTIPHPVWMREQCLACHSGLAARAELRTDHPERVNCKQCHVPGSEARSSPVWEASGSSSTTSP